MEVILVLRAVAALLKTQASAIVQHPPLDLVELQELQRQAHRLRGVALQVEGEAHLLEEETRLLEAEMTLEAVATLVGRPPPAPEIPATIKA